MDFEEIDQEVLKKDRKKLLTMEDWKKLSIIENQGPKNCEAKLFCVDTDNPNHGNLIALREMFTQVCKSNDFWPYLDQREKYPTIFKQLEMPVVSKKCIEKFKEEIEQGKELLLFKSE